MTNATSISVDKSVLHPNGVVSRRAVVAAGCAFAASGARGQTPYPSRPVRLVVPFPAGFSPDVVARLWGERFAKSTGQAVVVENRPGAGTIIAAQAVAAAPADGYTLFWTVNNTFSINPFIYRSLPYRAEDFVPITRILSVPFVLVVSAESSIHSLDDLVREGRARPGAMNYASSGIGTSTHVIMARLLNSAGITMTHVPYKESYLPDVIEQRIAVAFEPSTTAIANVRGGKIRALGVSSTSRLEVLKDVSAIAETFPGFVGESWQGIFAPKGTPGKVVATIVEHSQRIVEDEDFRATLTDHGLVPVGGTSAAFQQFLVEDARAWAQVVKASNITVD
ncbi:Bug family tripartite tricarboxylate transporter substrate binding protein [Variovorax sp. GT1P44]|uniref:Bug family tripartite tricarboxylate transporter substrate binding protein n=1 Tax=Variovorax sp. GT1P44 TaxID=3443742 RepID=UPI003F4478C4